jgi:hypothetical protein
MKYTPLFFDSIRRRWRRVAVGDIDELAIALEGAGYASPDDGLLEMPPSDVDIKRKPPH